MTLLVLSTFRLIITKRLASIYKNKGKNKKIRKELYKKRKIIEIIQANLDIHK